MARFRGRSSIGRRNASYRQYYGLQELDRKLEQFLDFDNGFFIEIGGWDGITYSNTLYFEKFRNWSGVLIEPSPNEFLKCHKNRPGARVYCCACVPFEYTEAFLPMTYCASMSIAHSSGAAVNEIDNITTHVSSGERFLQPGEAVYEFGALARPLSLLLDEENIQETIDLLVLDVEGFEISVLKGLDFHRHAPSFICVEARNEELISNFLLKHGYAIADVLSEHGDHKDILFARK